MPPVSSKGTSIAKWLTSGHAERGGDGGCVVSEGRVPGLIPGQFAWNTHRRGTSDHSAPSVFKKQKQVKWSSVQQAQNPLFQNTFTMQSGETGTSATVSTVNIKENINFQCDFCSLSFLVPRVLQGITECSACVFCPECDPLSAVPWPRQDGHRGSMGLLTGVGMWGWGDNFAYISNCCSSDIINGFAFLGLWETFPEGAPGIV